VIDGDSDDFPSGGLGGSALSIYKGGLSVYVVELLYMYA
jgi:hypothetical protein